MRLYWNLLAAMLLLGSTACGLRPPRSYYSRSYYSSVAPPASARLSPPYTSYTRADLQTNESKRREVSNNYPKKTSYRPFRSEDDYSNERYNSAEYSSESSVHGGYNSHEQDSREYTIGTQIRVQHPITVPKKATSTYQYSKQQPTKYVPIPYKGSSAAYLSDVNIGSAEEHVPEPPKRHKYTEVHYEPDPFHLVPPPKATVSSKSNSYSVFEPDHDDYDVRPVKSHDRYKGVASKKQIAAFLEDQQKLLDEAIKLQLLNNPKLHKFLKSKANEPRPDLDIEDFESYPPNFSGPLRNTYSHEHSPPPQSNRPRPRPPGVELKRSPKAKHIIKPKRKYRSTALVINV
ncbi:uncharacterized protein LOC115620276 [Scaptodrosophila lebanonensis]|uniref:Uncharacterized protein LOC115620276 n=1 Tax=Drosophila lebanonensis TaxID=7225 RepID=A0A6J2SZK0_DROLE|nr:uncharacterized protein LOC115620276 [Scaptodrosophila lebanonensis]